MEYLPHIAAAAVIIFIAGWLCHKAWAKFGPSERTLVFKAAAGVTKRIAALQSQTPDQLAALAASQAAEAVTLKQFQDAVAALK